ncbi:Transmembrane protein [Fragariocoptes setiger]|uniref:GDT1 family protein n=1 Tax=Fragariocoptes setiger TaxID=1670756 RepID=A0ABQ7SBS0_9ACAR|nr:Transmembrane protein [Fragariocoptes setiger]
MSMLENSSSLPTMTTLSFRTPLSTTTVTTCSPSDVVWPSDGLANGDPLIERLDADSKTLGFYASDSALIHALLASFSVVIVSEIGDKTFFITAIMAMRNSRLLVFLSSALALFVMTILSVVMGVAITVIPKEVTHIASIVLFTFFGAKMLKEACEMKGDEAEDEYKEVEKSLTELQDKSSEDMAKEEHTPDDPTDEAKTQIKNDSVNDAVPIYKRLSTKLPIYIAPVMLEVFTIIFVAEWGDRSQISTVILAAREDVVGVFVGSLLGHLICTGLAVIGGRFVADFISVKAMTACGGLLFIFFAVFAIINGVGA